MNNNDLAGFIFSAVEDTFTTMLGMPVTRVESGSEEPGASAAERVVALIGLAGSYIGTGIISCSPALACKLSSQMMMADLQSVDSEVLDAMGEICNMVFGNVKTMLEDQVGLLGLSIPTVIFGRNFATRSVGEQWVVVPLKVEEHNLDIRMCFSVNHNDAKPSPNPMPVAVSI